MKYKEYKLENTVGKLIKELKANNYFVMGYSELYPFLSFEVGKESKIPGRYHPIGKIDVGEHIIGKVGSFEIRLSIFGGDDSIRDKKKILSIAKKYLEKPHKKRKKESEHAGYKHHRWHNDGYRPARKQNSKYTCNIDEHKTPPQ